ncbi:hypothetical protein ACFYUV_16410 [Nonomuraea sp. NPDC003560]|uniref:hypothetical protein n=1 Tax=Nonomuraea sp. NPDC003560 TaxID=3364341 RepID=UPI0036C964A2
MSGRVVRLNLRGLGEGALGEVAALLSDDGQEDLTSLLVVDDVAALAGHRRAYEMLLASRYTDEVLCVAVGRPQGEPHRIALPGSLTQAAGVLWVPDPYGIDWRPAAAAPAVRRDRAEGAEAGLLRLLDVLSLSEVFHEALRRVERMPGRIANPGIRLAWTGAGGGDLRQALAAAGGRLLAAGGGEPPEPAAAPAAPPTAPPLRLAPGGPLASLADQARAALDEAAALGDELGDDVSLMVGPVPAGTAATAAGQALGRLRERLEELFVAAHSGARPDAGSRAAVTAAGIVPAEPEEFDAARVRASIGRYLDAGLRAGTPLPRLVEGLDRWQTRLMPHGSRALVPRLREVCPDALVAGLRDPEPMAGPQPWLPAVGLVSAALAGLTPFGVASGLVMALLWTLSVTLTVLRGPGGRPGGHLGALAANAAAAVVGGAAGGLAGAALEAAGILPQPAWALVLIVALAGAAWAIRGSWRRRTAAWAAARRFDAAAKAVDDLLSVAGAADREWARAGARVDAADATARVSAALAHVAAVVAERTRPPGGAAHDVPGRRDRRVEHFLADLVREAAAPALRGLAAGSTAEHGERAGGRAAELFSVWEKHVAEHGMDDPPPFATEWAVEADGAAPEEDLPELASAAGHDVSAVMWQLCLARDLSLLDVGAGPPAAVRFAPRPCRAALEESLPAGTVWVPSARHAGTLRLVPVRPGVARQTWADEPEPVQEGERR